VYFLLGRQFYWIQLYSSFLDIIDRTIKNLCSRYKPYGGDYNSKNSTKKKVAHNYSITFFDENIGWVIRLELSNFFQSFEELGKSCIWLFLILELDLNKVFHTPTPTGISTFTGPL
jgi:hypothetical protein